MSLCKGETGAQRQTRTEGMLCGEIQGEHHLKTEAETGITGPELRSLWHHPEAGGGKGGSVLEALGGGGGSAHTLPSTLRLHFCKTVNFCCSKPLCGALLQPL